MAIPSHISPAAPHQVPPTKIQVIVIATTTMSAALNQKRQNQARRRPTMSSSRSSALSTPNRLGHGINFRKTRSANPRNTITIPRETNRAFQKLQPFCCVNQTTSAGAVITATTVATLVSRRHERASSCEASPVGSVAIGEPPSSFIEVYAADPKAVVQRSLSGLPL